MKFTWQSILQLGLLFVSLTWAAFLFWAGWKHYSLKSNLRGAVDALNAGKVEQAQELLSNALNADPKNSTALHLLAKIMVETGKFQYSRSGKNYESAAIYQQLSENAKLADGYAAPNLKLVEFARHLAAGPGDNFDAYNNKCIALAGATREEAGNQLSAAPDSIDLELLNLIMDACVRLHQTSTVTEAVIKESMDSIYRKTSEALSKATEATNESKVPCLEILIMTYNLRGVLQIRLGDIAMKAEDNAAAMKCYRTAIQEFRRASAYRPKWSTPYNNISVAYSRLSTISGLSPESLASIRQQYVKDEYELDYFNDMLPSNKISTAEAGFAFYQTQATAYKAIAESAKDKALADSAWHQCVVSLEQSLARSSNTQRVNLQISNAIFTANRRGTIVPSPYERPWDEKLVDDKVLLSTQAHNFPGLTEYIRIQQACWKLFAGSDSANGFRVLEACKGEDTQELFYFRAIANDKYGDRDRAKSKERYTNALADYKKYLESDHAKLTAPEIVARVEKVKERVVKLESLLNNGGGE